MASGPWIRKCRARGRGWPGQGGGQEDKQFSLSREWGRDFPGRGNSEKQHREFRELGVVRAGGQEGAWWGGEGS